MRLANLRRSRLFIVLLMNRFEKTLFSSKQSVFDKTVCLFTSYQNVFVSRRKIDVNALSNYSTLISEEVIVENYFCISIDKFERL